jgi:uncharacterized protein YuzE
LCGDGDGTHGPPKLSRVFKHRSGGDAPPHRYISSSYDAEADVLYISFKQPSEATDSELTDDDVIVRYEGDEVIGLTILHASKR